MENACFKIYIEALPFGAICAASHVIPVEVCREGWNLWEAVRIKQQP